MRKEERTAVYDDALHIEAYRFQGFAQPFPNHFHEHYVIGLVEDGQRTLSCKNREYSIAQGDIVLFDPGDDHGCAQLGGGTFDYRGFHIAKDVMLALAEEVTGRRELPGFCKNVIRDEEIVCCLRSLHQMVMEGVSDVGAEENLLLLVSALIQKYGQPFEDCAPECTREIERACAFMEQNFDRRISLDQICRHGGLSKSALLRAFTRAKGVTPYRYLETVRINRAKALLEQGVPPIEAAARTGFSDQSHFTNYFSRFIGLAPGVYREMFFNRAQTEEKG